MKSNLTLILCRYDEYERTILKGKFDFSNEYLIGPRKCNTKCGNLGYLVITPFETECQQRVLVNRGHLAADDSKNLDDFQTPSNVCTFTGIARICSEKENIGEMNGNKITFRNNDFLAEQLGTSKRYYDNYDLEVNDRLHCNQTIQNFANRHLEYIFTWLGVCVGFIASYFYVVL